MRNNKNKLLLLSGFIMVLGFGTYNALMINSDSGLSASYSLKRLDEMNGVVIQGREIAVEKKWQKLEIIKTAKAPSSQVSANLPDAETAVLQGSLELKLSEVINPKKWQQPLNNSQFSGSVIANDGIIESLTVNLPGLEPVTVAFTEMTGNVFEYEYAGDVYSGLMYQVDQASYMVTLTNGPLEGTRMRFQGKSDMEQAHQYLAEVHQVEVGVFGSEDQVEPAFQSSDEASHATAFNFEAKKI